MEYYDMNTPHDLQASVSFRQKMNNFHNYCDIVDEGRSKSKIIFAFEIKLAKCCIEKITRNRLL